MKATLLMIAVTRNQRMSFMAKVARTSADATKPMRSPSGMAQSPYAA
jgi:hypothetical protein